MAFISTLQVFCILSMAVQVPARIGEKLRFEYFANATLPCDFSRYFPEKAVPAKRYWVLPDLTVLHDDFRGSDKFIVSPWPSLNLTVTYVTDQDFGMYQCMMIWDFYTYTGAVIQMGLNEDGPYFGKLHQGYRRSAMIGGLTAASLLLLIIGTGFVWHFRYSRRHHVTWEEESSQGSVYEQAMSSYYAQVIPKHRRSHITGVRKSTFLETNIDEGIIGGHDIFFTEKL